MESAPPASTLAPSPVLDLLRDAGELLGGECRTVARAIATGYPDSLAQRPAQLLQSAQVTSRSLDRLLAAAGVADFEDLRARAEREASRRLPSSGLRFTRRTGDDAPDRHGLDGTLRREQDNLAATLQALQRNGSLELAARSLLTARRRWVFGNLKSTGYAELFATDLSAALRDVTLVEPTGAAVLRALTDAHSNDAATVFCFRHYSRLTVQVAERFHDRGCTVVAVTDSPDSPVCAHADHVLLVTTRSDARTHSPTAVVATGHALATLAAAGAKGAARRARDTRAAAAALDWYEEDGDTARRRGTDEGADLP